MPTEHATPSYEALFALKHPDPTKTGIFRDHNCWKCNDGERPCASGAPNRCDYPRARND